MSSPLRSLLRTFPWVRVSLTYEPAKEVPVHAVLVTVTISDPEVAQRHLQEQVVPGVSQAPGFVSGYWTRKDNSGSSLVVFESEDAAQAMSERVPSMVPDEVTIENIDVREVVAHA